MCLEAKLRVADPSDMLYLPPARAVTQILSSVK